MRRQSKVGIILACALIAAIFLPGYSKYQKMRQENERLKKATETLREKNAQLIKEKRLLTEDRAYIEKKARQNLGLAKKGEIIYKLDIQESGHERRN